MANAETLRCSAMLSALLPIVAIAGCMQPLGPSREGKSFEVNLLEALVPTGRCPRNTADPATWTLMVYAAGDNDLEHDLMRNVLQMERGHTGSSSVNVVVQLDRESRDGQWRYWVGGDGSSPVVELVEASDVEPDSGNAETLREFGQWAISCFPAERYGLVVGGHGRPWNREWARANGGMRAARDRAEAQAETVRLLAFDKTDNSEMMVRGLADAVHEIATATRQTGDPAFLRRLAFYGSDACLMQTAEVAYQLRLDTDYIIGSEEKEPAQGWPYNSIVRRLTSSPNDSARYPQLLAQEIVDSYRRSTSGRGTTRRSKFVTLSALRAGRLRVVISALDSLSSLLAGQLENPAIAEAAWAARNRAFTFAESYADLHRFLTELRRELVDRDLVPAPYERWTDRDPSRRTLRERIDRVLNEIWPELLPENLRVAGPSYRGAGGLSIFLPPERCPGAELMAYRQTEFAQATGWHEVVEAMLMMRPSRSPLDNQAGIGDAHANVAGATHSVPVYCDVRHGELQVLTRDSSLGLDVLISARVDSNQWQATGAAFFDGNDFFQAADLIQMSDQRSDDTGLPQSGTVRFTANDKDITIGFACTSFEDRNCNTQ